MNRDVLNAITKVQKFYSRARFAFLSERDVQGRLYHELIGAFSKPQPHLVADEEGVVLRDRSGIALHTEGWAYEKERPNGIPDIYITDPRQVEASLKRRWINYHDPKDSIGIEIKFYFERYTLGPKQRMRLAADLAKLAPYKEGWFIAASTRNLFRNEKEWRAFYYEQRRASGVSSSVTGCYLCPELGSRPWIAR